MAGADIHRYSTDRRGAGLNALLATAAGGLAALADTLLLPTIVLALFAGQLTDSFVAIGVVAALGAGFWVLGRIPATLLVPARRRKQPWALGASLVRVAALGLLTLVAFRAQAGGEGMLRVLYVCFGAYSLASGFASVPIEGLVAKTAPVARRDAFYRQRTLMAGAGALVGALIAAKVLGPDGPGFPRQFALLFLAATVSHLAVAVLLASMREPTRVAEPRGLSPAATMRSVPRALSDPSFGKFFVFRVLLALTAIADPFLVLFALSRLGVPATAVGGYVVAYVAGLLVARPAWAALASRSGERTVLQASALLRLVPPLVALALPYLAATTAWRSRAGDGSWLEIVFGVAFACIGASASGQARGTFGYLGEFAPTRSRPIFATILNGGLGLAAFVPIVGGVVVTRSGYDTLFIVATIVALLAVFASGALTNAFVRRRPNSRGLPSGASTGNSASAPVVLSQTG